MGALKSAAIFLWALILFCQAPLTGFGAPEILRLQAESERVPIGLQTLYLRDDAGAMRIEEMLNPLVRERFKPLGSNHVNFGQEHRPHWFWSRIQNYSDQPRELVLQIYGVQPTAGAFLLPIDATEVSQIRRIAQDSKPHRFMLLHFTLKPFETRDLVLFKQSPNNLSFNATLWNNESFFSWDANDRSLHFLYYGAALVMLIYNLFLFLSLRDAAYFYYVCVIAAVILFLLGMDGIGRALVWPQFAEYNHWIAGFMAGCVPFSLTPFTIRLLDTKRLLPGFHKVLLVYYGYTILVLASALVLPFAVFSALIGSLGALFLFIYPPAGLMALIKGNLSARYFVAGWVIYEIGVFLITTAHFGWGNYYEALAYFKIGSFFEISLFSLALADRINLLQSEKQTAQAKQLQQERNFRQLLQKEVDSQTAELKQKNQALEHMNLEKSEFLGIAAHDLKSPLGGILGFTQLIEMETATQNMEEILIYNRMISSGARHMLELVSNFLDVSAIESATLPQLEEVDLRQVVQDTLEYFKPLAAAKQIRLTVRLDGEIPKVKAHPKWAAEVAGNLISNAVKYSPQQREVTLQLDFESPWVRLVVIDQGPGLSLEDKNKLFQKFTRLSAKPTGGESSTGLGLYIVKRMTEQMGGQVWCESTMGKGATFVIQLPSAS
ncbi:MAG: sensor histidine kinase [bacterium]|nr:sensor histidine kinase [bacterium]